MLRNLDADLFRGAGRVVKAQLGQISRMRVEGSHGLLVWALAQTALLKVEQHSCSASEAREILARNGRILSHHAAAKMVVAKKRGVKGDERLDESFAVREEVRSDFERFFRQLERFGS